MQERVGILGGTFNPVHLGHLILAQDALEEFELDRVLFIPGAAPPHKQESPVALAEHRLGMLQACLEGETRFSVSTVELDRGGVSYSIDTVRELCRQHPDADFYFIVGGDTLFELYTWKEIEQLLETCRFIVMGRPEFVGRAITEESLRLPAPWPERLKEQLTVGHLVDISSSDIRMRVAEGLSIRYLVPEPVEMYISEHHLYCD